MASGLTKDQLKNALISHGVELPSPSARKEEYLRLYEKFVAPLEQSKGDFSSDDEDSPVVPVENKAKMDQSLLVDGFDITSLSDEELYRRLKELGATAGPIVASTRKVYQRKLLVLMGGDVPDSPPAYNGDVDEDDYSDNEEVEEEPVEVEEPVRTRSSARLDTSTKSPTPSQNTDLRRRTWMNSDERPRGEVVYDPDRHTPSPRPSLRSVTSTTTTTTSSESIRVRNYLNNGGSGLVNASSPMTATEEEEEQDKQSKISLVVRLIVKLLFLALIIALIYYVYQNDPSESPFKAVEQLARQALEAAVGEEAKVKEGDILDPVEAPVDSPPPPEPIPAQ